MKLDVKDLYDGIKDYMDKEVTLQGWIKNHRKQKEFGFIDFSDGTSFKHVQLVYDKYVEWFGKDEFSYTDWQGNTFTGNYLDAMQMILDCARMKRFAGDDVKVLDVLTKMGITYE